jgi:hypothetical protein
LTDRTYKFDNIYDRGIPFENLIPEESWAIQTPRNISSSNNLPLLMDRIT